MLDASINISMEPFRAFVADMLPPDQRTHGFAMQSLFIGIGAVVASAMPWILSHTIGEGSNAVQVTPFRTQRASRSIMGSVAFLGCVLWTIFTTKEYPPEDLAAFQRAKAQKQVAWSSP